VSEQNHDLFILIVVDFSADLMGSALAIGWLRTMQGEWPDRDTMRGIVKIFSGIAAVGFILYFLFKYG
jgi:hypothetical protein